MMIPLTEPLHYAADTLAFINFYYQTFGVGSAWCGVVWPEFSATSCSQSVYQRNLYEILSGILYCLS